MNAEEALEHYRKNSDPEIVAAAENFKTLSRAARSELLYFMICHTNLLLRPAVTAAPDPEKPPPPPISEAVAQRAE